MVSVRNFHYQNEDTVRIHLICGLIQETSIKLLRNYTFCSILPR